MMSAALSLPPNAPALFQDDGSLNWEIHDVGGFMASTWTNPLSYLKRVQQADTRNLVSNVSLGYDLISGLLLSINAGYTDLTGRERTTFPRSSVAPDALAEATAQFVNSRRMSWIIEPGITYTKQFSKHEFNILVGTTWQKSTTSSNYAVGVGYVSDALLGSLEGARITITNEDDYREYRYNSLYARIGYNFKQKYLLNLTGRRDGSSRFGPGRRFGNFGAVGAAWLISEEEFMKDAVSVMNFAKIRTSYGITGSDQVGDYRYYNLYDILASTYGGVSGFVPLALYNPNFAWEVTKKMEIALELAFFENRIGMEINWYRNRSSNQLVDYPLPTMTGFPSVLSNFDATVENSGLEAAVTGEVLNADTWRWNLAINFSLPRNRLVAFDGIEESPYVNIYEVGEPLSVRWLYSWKGVNKETGNHEFVDENVDGEINDLDRKLMSPADRAYYGGVSSTIQHKGFEVSLLFQISDQKTVRYLPNMPGALGTNQPLDALHRWRQSGDVTDVQRFSANSLSLDFEHARQSNYNITGASFFRLKTASISYRIPQRWLETGKIREARIFLQGQNLFTITDYPGLDPETGSGLPPLRMTSIGVQLKL
jgi:TonB-linked SusC/RagA family outer membrane protein